MTHRQSNVPRALVCGWFSSALGHWSSILSLFRVSLSLSKAVASSGTFSVSLFPLSLDSSVCGDMFPLAWKCFRNGTGRCVRFCQAPVPFRSTEPKETWPDLEMLMRNRRAPPQSITPELCSKVWRDRGTLGNKRHTGLLEQGSVGPCPSSQPVSYSVVLPEHSHFRMLTWAL